jgi:hypothetical protein
MPARAAQVAGGRLGRAELERVRRRGGEHVDDPRLAAADARQQVRGDAHRRDVLVAQDLGGAAVQRRALARADVGVDGGCQQGVGEAQHARAGRAQDLAGGERVGGGGHAGGVAAGQRGDVAHLGVVAEDRDRARDARRVVGQAHEPHRHRAQDRFGRERADALGVVGRRPEALGLDRADELAEQKAVALGHAPAGVGERLVGRRQRRRHELAAGGARQRARSHRVAGRVRRDLAEQVVGRAGLAQAPCEHDRHAHRADALQQVEHEPQRRAVGPVRAVDRDQRGPRLGEVRQQPEEAVDDRVGAVVALVAAPARGALEQRPGQPGGAGEQAVVGLVVGARQQRLEELQRDAEGEVALELGAVGAQDADPARARTRDGGVEQRGLADARVALDQQQPAGALARRIEQLVDRSQLLFAFEEDSRARVDDGH